jgi:2-C-methyl-D-erythritol 4-phosphate cytidylyltransferase
MSISRRRHRTAMSMAKNSEQAASVAAILPAAGSGQRFGTERNKLFAMLADKPLWYHSAARLRAQVEVGPIVMAISDRDRNAFTDEYAPLVDELSIELVTGGNERTDSVRAGLNLLSSDPSIQCVAIHDAARPLVSAADLAAVFAMAQEKGAAILAYPVPGTIKRDLAGGTRTETVDRRDLWMALTPQVFHVGLLREAYQKHNGRPATDDAQLVERLGHDVALVRGSADNLKITYPEDLLIAEAILARQSQDA